MRENVRKALIKSYMYSEALCESGIWAINKTGKQHIETIEIWC